MLTQPPPRAQDLGAALTLARSRAKGRRIRQLEAAVTARRAVGDHAAANLAAAWLAQERAA